MSRAGISVLLTSVVFTVSGCGSADWGEYKNYPLGRPDEAPPDVILLMVSGHTGFLDGVPSYSYLDDAFGPALVSDLEDLGYSVSSRYYVDHPSSTDAPGYLDLVSDFRWIRDHWFEGWPKQPTVFLLAHSHGGVWATAATREVPDLPIRVQVAMDHSSRDWEITFHTLNDGVIGGSPVGAFPNVYVRSGCDPLPGDTTDGAVDYDLQDIVFPSVQEYLEIRTGRIYDENWNIRFDTTTDGLYCWKTPDNHDGTYRPGGATYNYILDFLEDRLPGAP